MMQFEIYHYYDLQQLNFTYFELSVSFFSSSNVKQRTKILLNNISIYRKHEMPIERRVDERNFRGEMRGSNDNRPSSYRNDRVDRPGDRMDRGRQMSPAQRTEQRDRFDNRRNVDEFRRDRHDGGNQPEWRGRDRPQGKIYIHFSGCDCQMISLFFFQSFRTGSFPS